MIDLCQFPQDEVDGFKQQLHSIKATLKDGKFLGEDGTEPSGQDIVLPLLERCLDAVEMVLERYILWFESSNLASLSSITERERLILDFKRLTALCQISAIN